MWDVWERINPHRSRWLLACGALLALGLCRASAEGQTAAFPTESPKFVLEDFEIATLGAQPFRWKEGRQNAMDSTIGVERAPLLGVNGGEANKALQIEYQFPAAFDATQGVEAGPMGQALPGSLTGLSLLLFGDGSGNALALRLQDRQGETFEWETPLGAKGWHQVSLALNPTTAHLSGRRVNGAPDAPLTFLGLRLTRRPNGAARGSVMIDNLIAECRFGAVKTLYDPTVAVQAEAWRVVRNHATQGTAAASRAPNGGSEVPALKLEFGYENGADASVEYQRLLPTGPGHGTLTAEVFGDSSNNLLRFHFRDSEGRIWSTPTPQALVDWSGWKTLYVDTRTLRNSTGPDPAAVPEKFPLSFQSLLVDDCSPQDQLPGVESGRKGEIYLGRLSFCSEP